MNENKLFEVAKSALEDTKNSPRTWQTEEQFEKQFNSNLRARLEAEPDLVGNTPKAELLNRAKSDKRISLGIADAIRNANADVQTYKKHRAESDSAENAMKQWALNNPVEANEAVKGSATRGTRIPDTENDSKASFNSQLDQTIRAYQQTYNLTYEQALNRVMRESSDSVKKERL